VEGTKQKVLIIKVGYSETLDPEISNVTSYGDVLRSTVLLNLYKSDHVTWLVDESAYPILKHNPFIDRILIYNLTSVLQLQKEHFDTVINLEKVPGLCALADGVTAWRRYGFRFDVKKGEAEAYQGTQYALSLCKDKEIKKNHKRYLQEYLFEMLGEKWRNERYVFGYRPKTVEQFDIGFNYKVGHKWPYKAWPMDNWKMLERLIGDEFSISWQEGIDNMHGYFEWINSCRIIVTNDSFGLHLAIALRKDIVALFGPTNPKEICFYGKGVYLVNEKIQCPYMHCHSFSCENDRKYCISGITPERVCLEIKRISDKKEAHSDKKRLALNR
jgi:heptosyltransferase-2